MRSTLPLLAVLLVSLRASACPGLPVSGQDLLLLGRGWENKQTHQRIALACMDQQCREAQFVYFDGPRLACRFGDKITIPKAPDAKLQEKATQAVVEAFFFTHHTEASAEKIDRGIIHRGLLMLGGLVASGMTVASGGTLFPIIAMAVGGVAATYLMTSSGEMEAMVSGRFKNASLSDQDGWNWDDRPKRLGDGRFRGLAARIQRGRPLEYMKAYGSGNRARRLEDKIWRVRNRLEKKGVDFGDRPQY